MANKIKAYKRKHIRSRKRQQIHIVLAPSKAIWLRDEDIESINQTVQALHSFQSRKRPSK